MQFVRHYRDLNTNIDALYAGMMTKLQAEDDLDVVSELKGDNDGKPFRTIIAVRNSVPKAFVGSLREVTFTITGKPDDYIVEVHTGSWLNNMVGPGTTGAVAGTLIPVIGTALGAAAGAGASTLRGLNYNRALSNEVKELVMKNSINKLNIHNVDHY